MAVKIAMMMMMMMMMMMAMDDAGSDNKEDVWVISLFSSPYGFPSNVFKKQLFLFNIIFFPIRRLKSVAL